MDAAQAHLIRRFTPCESHTATGDAGAAAGEYNRTAKGFEISTGRDMVLRLWDVATGQELQRFAGHAQFVQSVAISADGARALSVSADGTVRLWRLPEPK